MLKGFNRKQDKSDYFFSTFIVLLKNLLCNVLHLSLGGSNALSLLCEGICCYGDDAAWRLGPSTNEPEGAAASAFHRKHGLWLCSTSFWPSFWCDVWWHEQKQTSLKPRRPVLSRFPMMHRFILCISGRWWESDTGALLPSHPSETNPLTDSITDMPRTAQRT